MSLDAALPNWNKTYFVQQDLFAIQELQGGSAKQQETYERLTNRNRVGRAVQGDRAIVIFKPAVFFFDVVSCQANYWSL